MDEDSFKQVINIHMRIADLNIGPKIHNSFLPSQMILMDYIEKKPWQLYTTSPEPYHETMRALKKFHDVVAQPDLFKSSFAPDYWPFHFIKETTLTVHPDTPQSYMSAYSIVKAYSQKLAPWFSKHTSVCHGDFHNRNVLLDTKNKPFIIDLDTVGYGHPFYDIAKFTFTSTLPVRMALLKTYLGEREPTQEEAEHFAIITNVERIVDSTIKLEELASTKQLKDQTTDRAESIFEYAMNNIDEFLKSTINGTEN